MKDIIERIDGILEYTYNPHKVKSGRVRSKSSKLTGTEKLKYIKSLKKKAKERKHNPELKRKQKLYMKKHKRTSQYKRTMDKYNRLHKN